MMPLVAKAAYPKQCWPTQTGRRQTVRRRRRLRTELDLQQPAAGEQTEQTVRPPRSKQPGQPRPVLFARPAPAERRRRRHHGVPTGRSAAPSYAEHPRSSRPRTGLRIKRRIHSIDLSLEPIALVKSQAKLEPVVASQRDFLSNLVAWL